MSLGGSDKLCTAGRPPVTPEPSHTRPPASAPLSSSLCRPRRGRGHGHSGPRWCPAWRGEWDPDVGRCPGCEGWPVTAVEGAPGTGAGKGAVTPRQSDCAGRPGRAGRGRGWCWPLEEGPGHRRLGSGPGRATGSARQAGWRRAPRGPPHIHFPVASAPRHAHCPLCRPLPSVSPPLGQRARGRQRPCRTQPLPRAALCLLGTQRGAAKGALTVTAPRFQTPPSPPRSSGGRVSADAQALRGDGPPFSL